MPKLRHPELTKSISVSYLLDLYRDEPEFVKELDEIRRPYFPLLSSLADATLRFWAECKKALPPEDYWSMVEYYQGKSQQVPPLHPELGKQRSLMEQLWAQLQPYASKLRELTFKWRLRAPWAIPSLMYRDVIDFMTIMGLPMELDVPINSVGRLFPWSIPLPDLSIAVSPWAFFLSGKEQIQREMARKLSQYEAQVKAAGFHEFPSALRMHAKWWFEHYVHGKTYDEISQMEVYTPGGTQIVYARSVGEAVRRFSNLIGINPKALK